MPIIDKLIYYGNIIIALFVVAAIIAVVVYFVRANKRKKRKLDEDLTDYSTFDRKDSCEFVKSIDDIKDDMIILEGGNRFIGVVGCQGYDLYSAEEEEQASTAQNFVGFVNTIKKRITYRQYSKNIDLEYTMNMYKSAHERVETRLFNVVEDIKDLENSLKNSSLSDNEKNIYKVNIERLENEKRALENREYHLREEIEYCDAYSGSNVLPELKETWVFEWTYYAYDFPVELTKEEIYKRAQQELKTLENTFSHALSSCRVKTRRCNTEELIEMCRRYSAPLSAERYRLRDIMSSTYFEDIVTTDNIDNMIEKARKKVMDEFTYEFEQEVKESIEKDVREQQEQANESDKLHKENTQAKTGPVPANEKTHASKMEGGQDNVV